MHVYLKIKIHPAYRFTPAPLNGISIHCFT